MVLREAYNLDPYQIMLIQGPPGTGKTTTIVNMIEFLVKTKKKKIHVCAPSNSAVDEIVLRCSKSSVKDQILRIGAIEHKIKHEELREVTLEEKLKPKARERLEK
jgi:ABC-type proline/glycine betaine transport system ATPase subunit